ncbi:hypothetical protein JKP88DRAFT_199228 [Tribonema minus]|uniref:Uncharacterized protein n=1 Tax=Tribonema minus TaxID=303371 RepID=A0A835YX84_9STRA|nr:hypothetical protein JKP88DRAFT_199228 [Tribonema minus]
MTRGGEAAAHSPQPHRPRPRARHNAHNPLPPPLPLRSDKLDDRTGRPAHLLLECATRGALLAAAYAAFPHVCAALAPLIYGDGSAAALNERVRAGLTGSFLPGISLLFGTLFSYTISLLVNRQNRIEELVNQELAAMTTLLWHLIDFFDGDPEKREQALKAVWRHTDQLIFNSRYQEILALVQGDSIEELMRMIIRVDEKDTAQNTHKPNINRELLGYLRPLGAEINRLRAMRISAEGRVLPPVHFFILGSLAMLLLFGFTLTSMQAPLVDDTAAVLQVPQESRILFALLVNAFSALLGFALDLTNPFNGRYKVRRTTATAYLIKIRNDIVQTLGVQTVTAFDAENRCAVQRELTRFREITGTHLPVDRHL